MVELKEITADNFEDIINLKVSEQQESFVSSGFIATGVVEDNMEEMRYIC